MSGTGTAAEVPFPLHVHCGQTHSTGSAHVGCFGLRRIPPHCSCIALPQSLEQGTRVQNPSCCTHQHTKRGSPDHKDPLLRF